MRRRGVLRLLRPGAVLAGLCLLCPTAPALGQGAETPPAYLDDRSSAQSLVQSLYNAIERREYLRAWSYFDEGAVRDPDSFAEGYENTAHVRVRLGRVVGEGAAGSLYASVPVVVEAIDAAGAVTVFAGCYETRQVQPAAQIEPPFRPIRIIAGRLQPSGQDFDSARGDCPEDGL